MANAKLDSRAARAADAAVGGAEEVEVEDVGTACGAPGRPRDTRDICMFERVWDGAPAEAVVLPQRWQKKTRRRDYERRKICECQ